MKKIILFICGIFASAVISCSGGSSSFSQVIDLYEGAINEVDDAQTAEELRAIQTKLSKATASILSNIRNTEPSDDEIDKMESVGAKFMEIFNEKVNELK